MARKMGKSSVLLETGEKKTYRNMGVSSLKLGKELIEPGMEFSAILKPEFETQMFMSGQLELVKDAGPTDKSQEDAGVRERKK